MEQHQGWFSLNSVAREIGVQRIREQKSSWYNAHSLSADYYKRPFVAKRIVGRTGQLGGYFVEARYHLVQAGRDAELEEISDFLSNHLKETIRSTDPIPQQRETLNERIAVLSALLEQPGPAGLEYHLSKLLQYRCDNGDLQRALIHARRAIGKKAPVVSWELLIDLEMTVNGLDAALEVGQDGIQKVSVNQNLFSLYSKCSNLLVQDNRLPEAIQLLQDGIQKIPANKGLFSLCDKCSNLLAQDNRLPEAIQLLQDGIQKIPAGQNLSSLYGKCSNLLAQDNRLPEAIQLLQDGIQKIPANKGLSSIYDKCSNLLAQDNRLPEAIQLLQDGIQKIPASNLSLLYDKCSNLLAQDNRLPEAIQLLLEGAGRMPIGKFNRHKLTEKVLLLSLSLQDYNLIEEIVQNSHPGMYSPQQIFLGRVLSAQLEKKWEKASTLAEEGSLSFPTYLILYTQGAFSWLCCSNPTAAKSILELFPKTIQEDKAPEVAWLVGFINLKLGNLKKAQEAVSKYLEPGERGKPITSRTLLQMWKQSAEYKDYPSISYYYPILPSSLTNLETTVTRFQYSELSDFIDLDAREQKNITHSFSRATNVKLTHSKNNNSSSAKLSASQGSFITEGPQPKTQSQSMEQFTNSPLWVKIGAGIAVAFLTVVGVNQSALMGPVSTNQQETTSSDSEEIEVEVYVYEQSEAQEALAGVEVVFKTEGAPETGITNTQGYAKVRIIAVEDIDIELRKDGFKTGFYTLNLQTDRSKSYFLEKK